MAGREANAPGSVKPAVYARLSVNENGERDESLETQCALLAGYVEEQGWGRALTYIDSDVSGTCFKRPGLSRMINDIDIGLINMLVVKDLSRLGRNNGETLTFLDYLVEKKVRLISLGDGYDSLRDEDDTIGIRTWVNEYYARDISRKVRANLKKKMQSGEFLGRPPFGYRKSSRVKNRLEVDERYRDLIREVFTLYIQGWGYRALAGHVQSIGVPTPSQDKGYAGAPSTGRWEGQHIRRIITNRVYCGDTVQGVSEKLSFKSRKTRRLPGERWVIVPDTHEPIITRETYELAQRVRERRVQGAGRKVPSGDGPHLFTGLVFCGACGGRHIYRKQGESRGGYVCGRYNRLGRRGCSSHYVAEKQLVDLVLGDVREMAVAVPFHERLASMYKNEQAAAAGQGRAEKLAGKIQNRRRQLKSAYLDKIRDLIPEELFLETSALLQGEINAFQQQLEKLSRAHRYRPDEAVRTINAMGPEMLGKTDMDRCFLEQYVNKILVLDEGDLKRDQPAVAAAPGELIRAASGLAGGGLLVVYNLAPE